MNPNESLAFASTLKGFCRAKVLYERGNPTGDWVYGYHFLHCGVHSTLFGVREYEHHFIVHDVESEEHSYNNIVFTEIDPDTLCMYLYVTDNQNNMIFERDIVQYGDCTEFNRRCSAPLSNQGEVIFVPVHGIEVTNRNTVTIPELMLSATQLNVTVIGNTIDNPEIEI